MDKYLEKSKDLVEKLSTFKGDERLENFVQKYKTWAAFFEEILKIPERAVLPKIHALVATSRVITLSGLAESSGSGDGYGQKFSNFINFLSIEEKLFFCLIFDIKRKSEEQATLYQQYLNDPIEDNLKKLTDISSKQDDKHEEEIMHIMNSFLEDDIQKLNSFFKERVDLFYGVRSKIVHEGSPDIMGAMLSSHTEAILYYGEKENKFFTLEYPIEEFFIRAAYRIFEHEPEKIEINDFLYEKFLARHAPRVIRIVNKINGK